MNEEQIATVQSTWAIASPMADDVADLFYDRLFEIDPSLRPMFPEDLEHQKKKLMQMLGRLVGTLDNLEDAVPAIQALGRRHHGYGVDEAHYATVGRALRWSLKRALGEEWDAEVSEAWTAVYGLIAGVMISAAREVVAAE